MEWLLLIIGLLVGGGAAWFLTRSLSKQSYDTLRDQINEANKDTLEIVRGQIDQKDGEILRLRELYDHERVAHAELRSKLDETERNLEAQQKFVEDSQTKLADAFSALSKDALSSNADDFLKLAKTRLETLLANGKGDLDRRKEAIDNLLKPLNESLKNYQEQTRLLETNLKKDYGSLEQHLKSVASTTESLTRETANLGQALRAPQVRGRWGELTLKNVAELAGMSEHCDFTEQLSVDTEEGKQRPDMIVHLPGGRQIVVDAKVPLVAFLDALQADTSDERKAHLERHAGHVKTHMRQLSSKSYWSQFDEAPDFVVMFIPGESFFSAAVDADHGLIEEGMRSNVILASPTTFVALLRTVALGWRQEQIAHNAARISRLGAEIHERIVRFVSHFAKVGKSLEQATVAYNSSVSSLESRVLVSARRFKELGATGQDDIPEVTQVDRVPRSPQTELLPSGESDGSESD